MDEADAEEAVEGVGPSAEMPVEKATKKPDQVASDGQPKPVVAKSAVVFAAIPDPATGNKGGATTKAASPGDKSTTATAVLPVNEVDMVDASVNAQTTKRPRELETDAQKIGGDSSATEPHVKTAPQKKMPVRLLSSPASDPRGPDKPAG